MHHKLNFTCHVFSGQLGQGLPRIGPVINPSFLKGVFQEYKLNGLSLEPQAPPVSLLVGMPRVGPYRSDIDGHGLKSLSTSISTSQLATIE